ncbi:Crp/Fnr family transcriptional regulator [Paraburkholderia sp. LEh10]|uniref:Crp/Fnr family transcriptional regulator n=1 Tax=Paraburkholderia sp. LEh10 TaxID=2821353 RepID=UPI001AE9219A|nr:Crp/Fnr family transcriptional regulator [Paraburkholderia sp. LEh10]MBP0589291.1 Crp/Fnr family transcriptional regulator [Paraburkholderia sp. LEh10]
MKEEALNRLLKEQKLLAASTDGEWKCILEWVRVVRIKVGAQVAFASDENSALHMLLEGELRAFIASVDGRETPICTLGRGQAIGMAPIIQQAPLPFSVTATAPSTVASLSRTHVRLLLRSPSFMHSVSEQLAAEYMALAQRVEKSSAPRANARVAAVIASRLSEQVAGEWPAVEIPDQATMAALAQVSRETVSRVLKALETDAIIIRMGRRLRIRDVARLQRIAAGLRPD